MNLWRYGALGVPLAFVSLPLYVTLPHFYASRFDIALPSLGAVLLATRALDAFIDPLIGRWVDWLFAAGIRPVTRTAWTAALVMSCGFGALWFPPVIGKLLPLVWLAAALMIVYAAFSTLSVIHQAWGARWGGSAAQRARIVAWREGSSVAGVLLASLLPALAGYGVMAIALGAGLALGIVLLARSGIPPAAKGDSGASAIDHPPSPWTHAPFRSLLGVFTLNGIAAAIPATLLPFYVQDRLQTPGWEPFYLGVYFVCAALAMPLWVRVVRAVGLADAWMLGMALSIAAFVGAYWLGAGDRAEFLAICAASGLALGADLALPSALLAGVVRSVGDGGRGEGRYFGWWACATKLNLAFAAGLALPLLSIAGYSTGTRSPAGLAALGLAYGGVPCLLKMLAAAALWRVRSTRPTQGEIR